MSTPVAPLRTPCLWLVTRSSGARHLIDTTNPKAPTVTRWAVRENPDATEFALGTYVATANRCCDRCSTWQGVSLSTGCSSVSDMHLVLELLDADAQITARRATPVTDIEPLLHAVAAEANMPETDRLLATLERWWPAIEVLIITSVTNARTAAATTTIKNIKRTGRGFRNENNYTARILLTSAARTAA